MPEFPSGDYVSHAELDDALGQLPPPPSGVTSVVSPIGAPLSGFAGDTVDEKLDDYNRQRLDEDSPVHGWPVLLDKPLVYTVNSTIDLADGFCVVGGVRPVDQPRGSKPIGTQLNLRLSGGNPWLRVVDETFGCALIGLSMDADSDSRVFGGPGVLWTTTLRDVSYQNGPGIFGSSTEKCLWDVVTIEGFCNWNNLRDSALNVGGSDNSILCSKLLIDSPPSYMGPKNYLLRFLSMSKSDVSGLYITAEQHSAILCQYGNEMLAFDRNKIEGRNAGQPCYGALLRLECDFTQWTHTWLAYGMSNPSAGANPKDKGLVHCTEGLHEFDHCHTRRANGVSEDVPFIFGEGEGTVIRATNIVGVGYSGKPVVKVVGGAVAECDDTVEVVAA